MDAGDEVRSVKRAVALLERLASRDGGHGVTELARELGVHKSSASRLLATLRAVGLVEIDETSGRYELGAGLLRLAASAAERLDIGRLSLAVLGELAAVSGETTYLSVRRGHFRIAVQETESENPVRMVAGIGRPYPLYAGASSKVLLAALPPPEVAAVMDEIPRGARITRQELRAQIPAVRRDGYALSFGENEPAAASIAVPVYDHLGSVAAAVAIAGVRTRWDHDRMLAMLPQLRASAERIGLMLGRRGSAEHDAS